MIGSNFISPGCQEPCSSTANSLHMYPPSNKSIPNPDSPFIHSSPRPPSRTITPGRYTQMASIKQEPNLHTQMWMQQYQSDQSVYAHSSAPSVMSTMTRVSDMSMISINTQATGMSMHPSVRLGQPQGPISSGSHSENIDPQVNKENISSSAEYCMRMITDPDQDVRTAAITNLLRIPARIKQEDPERNTDVVKKLIYATIAALKAESVYELQVRLCDSLRELTTHFCTTMMKLVSKEFAKAGNQIPSDGIFVTLLEMYNIPDANRERMLRHLFPVLHIFFLQCCDQHTTYARHARNTRFFFFLRDTLLLLFRRAQANRNLDSYVMAMKYPKYYMQVLEQITRGSDDMKILMVQSPSFLNFIRDLTAYHLNNPNLFYAQHGTEFFLKTHKQMVSLIKTIVSTEKKDEVVDPLVSKQIVEILLLGLYMIRQANIQDIRLARIVLDTFRCLSYVSDSVRLQDVKVLNQLANSPQSNITRIVFDEFRCAVAYENVEIIVAISQFLANASRYEMGSAIVFTQYGLNMILNCLSTVLAAFSNTNTEKKLKIFIELTDNFLLTCLHCDSLAGEHYPVFCDMFLTILNRNIVNVLTMNKVPLIVKLVKIWWHIVSQCPAAFDPAKLNFSAVEFIWSCTVQILNIQPPSNSSKTAIVGCADILRHLACLPVYLNDIRDRVMRNIVDLLNVQQDVTIIITLLSLIVDLWQQCIPLRHAWMTIQDLRNIVERFTSSTNTELAQKAQGILNGLPVLNEDMASSYIVNNDSSNLWM